MSNALAKKDIYLDLSIDDDGFDFATSIDDALAQAEAELVVLNETVESIKELKPQCDKLDYILAASSGALCGVPDHQVQFPQYLHLNPQGQLLLLHSNEGVCRHAFGNPQFFRCSE